MYGSFTSDEGDAYSDIEFFIYIDDKACEDFQPQAWVSQISPMVYYYVNEFGVGTAIFENLVRGEFHFEPAKQMAQVRGLRAARGFPPVTKLLIADKTNELTEHLGALVGPDPERGTPEEITRLRNSFINWMLFGTNVLARGERTRALELLWFVQRNLLWMARLAEQSTRHWFIPARKAEQELSLEAQAKYAQCAASLEGNSLEQAYAAAWTWGKDLLIRLTTYTEVDPLEPLLAQLDERLTRFLTD